jgi:maleylacetate reductase
MHSERQTMPPFTDRFTTTLPGVRLRFGPGIRHQVGEEMDSLGLSRALILTTPQQAETGAEFAQALGHKAAGVFSGAAMHTPTPISEEATALAQSLGADCLLAIGGGSTTGLGKAIALRTDLPQIVIPTTYAGSEATGILGQTENGRKTTITTPKVQPEVILYDAELVCTLPVAMTVTSALNAMSHAAEGLYAQNRSPFSTLMAIEGLRAFRDALPRVLDNPADLTARGETLYGAWLCGTVLGTVGMALHHKLCHTLGGSFDLPHAETHAIILPHGIAYNEVAAARELAPIADLFGAATPGLALHAFATRMGAPTALREIGMPEADLDRATDLATQNPYWNPRPVETQALRRLLQHAWDGREPGLEETIAD